MDLERNGKKSGRCLSTFFTIRKLCSCCHWIPAISIFDGNYVAGVYAGAGVERRNISSMIVEVEKILSPNGKGLLFTEMQSLSPKTVELLRLRSPGFEQKQFLSRGGTFARREQESGRKLFGQF